MAAVHVIGDTAVASHADCGESLTSDQLILADRLVIIKVIISVDIHSIDMAGGKAPYLVPLRFTVKIIFRNREPCNLLSMLRRGEADRDLFFTVFLNNFYIIGALMAGDRMVLIREGKFIGNTVDALSSVGKALLCHADPGNNSRCPSASGRCIVVLQLFTAV